MLSKISALIGQDSGTMSTLAPSSPATEATEDDAAVRPSDIFVGNLSLFTTEAKLREHFQRFGTILDVRIMVHQDSRKRYLSDRVI